MCLIYSWRVTTSWVRRPLWVNQPGQLSLLLSVGRGMSSISVARWVKLLAAVSPSSECLYEGKADVVYLQVTLCEHIWALSGRDTDDRRYTSPLSFPFLFLSWPKFRNGQLLPLTTFGDVLCYGQQRSELAITPVPTSFCAHTTVAKWHLLQSVHSDTLNWSVTYVVFRFS